MYWENPPAPALYLATKPCTGPKVRFPSLTLFNVICEPAICYTGDILNPKRSKYNLKYYVELAKELEKLGAHILAIKDMAGLCKPYAARLLVKTLKQEIEAEAKRRSK